jgi:hypothetical protein
MRHRALGCCAGHGVLRDCTPAERYAMTVKNVVQLYKLPFEV